MFLEMQTAGTESTGLPEEPCEQARPALGELTQRLGRLALSLLGLPQGLFGRLPPRITVLPQRVRFAPGSIGLGYERALQAGDLGRMAFPLGDLTGTYGITV
jgi:hypothetical protein